MLKEIIFDYIENNEEDYIYKKKEFTASPSSINDCRRKIFYRKMNYKQSNPISIQSKIKMATGNLIHDYIKTILEKTISAKYLEGEILKSTEYHNLIWWYKIDNLIEFKNIKYMIEVKSTYLTGWNEVQNNAKPEHILQLLLYMIFENIDNGIILYFDRTSGFMIEYNFTMEYLQQNYLHILYDKIEGLLQLKDQINNNILPDRDYQAFFKRTESLSTEFQKDSQRYKTDWHCSYCQYFTFCWGDIMDQLEKGQFYIDGKII